MNGIKVFELTSSIFCNINRIKVKTNMYHTCFQCFPIVLLLLCFLSDVHGMLKINTYIKCSDCICSCTCIVLAIIL